MLDKIRSFILRMVDRDYYNRTTALLDKVLEANELVDRKFEIVVETNELLDERSRILNERSAALDKREEALNELESRLRESNQVVC